MSICTNMLSFRCKNFFFFLTAGLLSVEQQWCILEIIFSGCIVRGTVNNFVTLNHLPRHYWDNHITQMSLSAWGDSRSHSAGQTSHFADFCITSVSRHKALQAAVSSGSSDMYPWGKKRKVYRNIIFRICQVCRL